MRIDSEFTVKAPIEVVWAYLLDVERIAPCMPGAQLTEVVDDHTWKGKTNIKIGPVSLSFAGTVELHERDDSAHRVVLKAQGMEQRGKGAASASVVSYLQGVDDGTKVVMETDLSISGAVAQYGRGMILDISQRMTREFAQCLESNLSAASASDVATAQIEEGTPAPQAPAPPARPVRGLRLGIWAVWRVIARFFRRLFGRKEA
jgi:carbon monoxide dehydrogenase subunit G